MLPSASPHLCFALLRFALLSLASPVKLSQALDIVTIGYRMSRVWIWSSENGRQGGVGQPSRKGYQYDEEMNSVKEE
jgi:hypothetical protein